MWIPPETLPWLLEEVKELLADALARDDDGGWDPNDLIIWDGFVRPVLEDKLGSGFDSEEMLHKGFGFLVELIPGILERRAPPARAFGALARVYHAEKLRRALDWVGSFEPEDYEANLRLIRDELEAALRIRTRG